MYTHLNPLLYSKTGVCMGKHIFLIFAQKHRLWVLFRNIDCEYSLKPPRRKYPQSMFVSKNKKNMKKKC